ncbi:hypothetical protein OROGR_026784 [Orobanche gracilis]
MSFGQPSYLKYEDKFCGQCHKKLQIRVVSSRARNYQKLFYFCHEHTFDSWCNPINEQELHQEGESTTRDGNAVKEFQRRSDILPFFELNNGVGRRSKNPSWCRSLDCSRASSNIWGGRWIYLMICGFN